MYIILFHATEDASNTLLAALDKHGVTATLVNQTPHERWYDAGDLSFTAKDLYDMTGLMTTVMTRLPGEIVDHQLTIEECTAIADNLLKKEAAALGYDSIMSACSYATSTVPKFAAEGQAFVAWRDAMWSEVYDLLAEYESTGVYDTTEEFMAKLPVFTPPSIA